jgi:hypothetical protein
MTSTDISNIEVPGRFQDQGPEVKNEFIPTPQRISEYLELKTDDVEAQMKSVEGRKALYEQLLTHEDSLRQNHENFDPMALQTQLDNAGEALSANERYLQQVRSPEQKGMFQRAWETVKGFPRNHPVVTAVLAAATLAGGVAAGFYLTGNWEMLMTSVGLATRSATADIGGGMPVLEPTLPPLPGAGTGAIPTEIPINL